MKIIGIIILLIFYSVYFGKMILQRRKGIQTDQMAKGVKKDKTFFIELILKIATYSVGIADVMSVMTAVSFSRTISIIGMIIGFAGDIIFAAAVITMKDSWRAGLARDDETKMVTNGIYQFSRNPAFLAFDCVYLGILFMFFNPVLLVLSLWAMIMLHLQILQEENYLVTVFGGEYNDYKRRVCRYIGRKHSGRRE